MPVKVTSPASVTAGTQASEQVSSNGKNLVKAARRVVKHTSSVFVNTNIVSIPRVEKKWLATELIRTGDRTVVTVA